MKLRDLRKDIVDNVLMKQCGLKAVFIIRRRTLEGKFLPGATSDTYSEKPFAMPLGAVAKTLGKKIESNKKFSLRKRAKIDGKWKSETVGQVDPGEFQIITTKAGALWVIIGGGYKRYRELSGRQNDKVDLNWSGRMMRNLNIMPGSLQADRVDVGFPSADERKKAEWHNILGAGRSKRLHPFMGMTAEEEVELTKFAGEEIAKKIITALDKYRVIEP